MIQLSDVIVYNDTAYVGRDYKKLATGFFIDPGGIIGYYNEGELHREDGPAVEYPDGTKEWFLNNYLVYSGEKNHLHKYNNLSDAFKMSIVKYELKK
jgi:hypothetical protein